MHATLTPMQDLPALTAEELSRTALLAAALFVRQPDDAAARAFWSDAVVRRIACAAGLDASPRATAEGWRLLGNAVLQPGMPAAAVPVESLHKPWDGRPGSPKGLYLGASAAAMRELLAALELEVPREFSATPDHLTLLLETLSVFADAGNAASAAQFAAAHLDWLDDYRRALQESARGVAHAYAPAVAEPLVQAVEELQTVLTIVDCALEAALKPLGASE